MQAHARVGCAGEASQDRAECRSGRACTRRLVGGLVSEGDVKLMRAGLLIGLAMLGSVSTAHAGNVQDQADCARVAQKDFDVAKAHPSGKALSGFESHYNTKMHACLTLQHFFDEKEPAATSLALFDEISGHIFANYMDHQHTNKTTVSSCYFEPTPYDLPKSCNSLDEFMAGIKPYMTE